MNTHNESILTEYIQNHAKYEQLEESVTALLENELKQSDIMVFQMSHRLKTEDSLRGKLEKKGDKYDSALDLTDLLGVRVICYFADDVDRIAETIEGLFIVDRENSVDKRRLLEDDQFGYMSLHYICHLSPEQTDAEDLWKIRFEIQIRSVLQHAWAEINHDIGYKSSTGVPRSIIRGFSRLAGLLEIADEQFAQFRNSVRQYQNDSAETVRSHNLEELPVNEMTLYAFLKNDSAVQESFRDSGIALITEGCEESAERLEALQILTMDQFAKMASGNLEKALELAVYENNSEKPETVSAGMLVRLLIEACLMNGEDPEAAIQDYFLKYYGEGKSAERKEKDLLKYIKRMKKGKGIKTKGSQIL